MHVACMTHMYLTHVRRSSEAAPAHDRLEQVQTSWQNHDVADGIRVTFV